MATLEEDAWKRVERWADIDRSSSDLCLLDLRRRVEALEQRALTAPEPSAAEPAANRPLWKVMYDARCDVLLQGEAIALRTSAEIDAVASWLEQRYLDRYPGAAELLRNEARRAREGA